MAVVVPSDIEMKASTLARSRADTRDGRSSSLLHACQNAQRRSEKATTATPAKHATALRETVAAPFEPVADAVLDAARVDEVADLDAAELEAAAEVAEDAVVPVDAAVLETAVLASPAAICAFASAVNAPVMLVMLMVPISTG